MTTAADLARRPNGHAPQPGTALAIQGGQTTWNDKQRAALVAMGVSEKATNAELAVFFHQCRNTQLDPFLKQIYFIHRRVKEGDRWVEKPSTQVGIDGFRVIRDRIADKKGLRVEYEDTIWYDDDRNAYDVWVWDEPPAACKMVVLVDGRRFPSVLRFKEYCQSNRDGDRLGRWRDGFAHQIEKCCEADALRKAFPNDMAGLVLEDAAPMGDPDAPDRLPQDRRHVTAEDIRQRHPVTAEVVTPPDASPAASGIPPAASGSPGPDSAAGEAPERPPAKITSGQQKLLDAHRGRLGYDDSAEDWDQWLADLARLAGLAAIAAPAELTQAEAKRADDQLKGLDMKALRKLLDTGEVPDGH